MTVNGNKKKTGGFSLVEVVITMAVLSVGLMGFISLYGAGFKALQGSSFRTVAVRLAQDRMERLRVGPPIPTLSPDPSDTPKEGMTRSWSVRQREGDSSIWVISVEVTWTNQTGQNKKVVLKSFRSL